MKANRAGAIRAVCEGMEGVIQVNGTTYNNVMPAQVLNDDQVAAVLTYVTNAWGNQGEPYTPDEVKETRAKTRFPIGSPGWVKADDIVSSKPASGGR